MNEKLVAQYSVEVERPLDKIEYEIKELTKQAQTAAVYYAINIGGRLLEAKSQVPHGEWENWLTERVNYSQRTAETYIQVYKEYGNVQEGFFGTSNPAAFESLSFTKLVTLLAIPAEDREEFAKDIDAENISVRELKEEIKKAQAERDKALQEAKEAEDKYSQWEDEETERQDKLREAAEAKQTEIDELKAKILELENPTDESCVDDTDSDDNDLATLRAEIEAEQKAKFQKKLDKLEKDKEKLIKDADDLKAKIDAAKQTEADLEQARKDKAAAEVALADTQKKLALSANPAMQSLDFYFKQVQADIQQLKNSLVKLKESDPEQYAKFAPVLTKTLSDAVAGL